MEYFRKAGVLSKARSIVSALYGIVLWVTRLSSPMQAPKALPAHLYLQLGLSALICSTVQSLGRSACNIIHSYMVSSSSSLLSSTSSSSSSSSSPLLELLTHSSSSLSSSSSWSWSSTMGDLIGTENGVYMSSHEDILPGERIKPNKCRQRKANQRHQTKIREHPPPIPSLARTGKLPCRMPWVLTRHYVDGRLILKKESVKNYEYFETRRENGRLILNLVPLDHTIPCCHRVSDQEDDNVELEDLHFIEEGNENTQEDVKVDEVENDGNGNGDDDGNEKKQCMVVDQMVDKEFMISFASFIPEPSLKNGIKKERDLRKRFTYGGRRTSNPRFFHMAATVNSPIDTIVRSSSAPLSSALLPATICDVA